MLFSYLTHRHTCAAKQQSRADSIAALPGRYHEPLNSSDAEILNAPVALTASNIRSGGTTPLAVLTAFTKRALWAHGRTNCLTEILIPSAEASLSSSSINLSGALAGVPVSLKDTVNVVGYHSCIGYSSFATPAHKAKNDAVIVSFLRQRLGAVPFMKTNVPITLLSFESTNDVWGRTDNPWVPGFSPGGSTGGEAALLALGGSRIGVGTDVAGSVRVPAAWSGIYALRCSTGRFPRAGCTTSMAGQEGVMAVYSPMAKTLPDLQYFMKSIVDAKPWEVDWSVHPLPWREEEAQLPEKVRWGVLRDDGVVPPTPAVERALNEAIEALRARGDEVVELQGHPSCYTSLRLAARLLNSDAGTTYTSFFASFFERNDPGVAVINRIFSLPRWVKRLWAFFLRLSGDAITAGLVEDLHPRTVAQQWALVAEREQIRGEWFHYLQTQKVDFIITPPHPTPAVPAGGMRDSVAACGYTFLWNLLDYTAGVLPVGRVDPALDKVQHGGRKLQNGVAKRCWRLYDAASMKGLPVAVQVVAPGRLREEMVLAGMKRVEEALSKVGRGWEVDAVEIE
ncbi:acetamidase [Sphaerosporella brunnea]|uniref:amidase n=1 Tax=Sphaerosporella brunnea TaxID=1250544 RepID=A0A5J5F9G5_9PEZI|nr:acetamidase [Sphaerosporella brunnea]